MSLVGPISGALVAGGLYYGFSNLIQTRTEQHRKDLHFLSARLVETPTLVQASPSAASRIQSRPLATEVKAQWNREVEYLFRGFQNLDRSVVDWGRTLLYGPPSQDSGKKVNT